MASLRFDIDDAPTTADADVLANGLEAYNELHWPRHQSWQPLGVFAREQQAIKAGLFGETYAGWLFVRYLWVSEGLRGQGVGRRLLGIGEKTAVERGCHAVWLDTFSFQALGFYQKLGYTVFAELDWSAEHKRYFLRKSLEPDLGRAGDNAAQ